MDGMGEQLTGKWVLCEIGSDYLSFIQVDILKAQVGHCVPVVGFVLSDLISSTW